MTGCALGGVIICMYNCKNILTYASDLDYCNRRSKSISPEEHTIPHQMNRM